MFFAAGLILVFLFSFPIGASGQDFPNKPITIYCGYAAGASTDLTTRFLANGAEKMLGVPVVVENKPGGAATVCASLVASKKSDGYTLAVVDSGAISTTPLRQKVPYDPKKDFTVIMQYARYCPGGVTVLSDFPAKTIDEFIAYAKAHPGLSYGSTGVNQPGHIGIELFAHCKGLKFKHIPYKGGSEAITALMGKHTDFMQGAGGHIPYVRQGVFRLLMVFAIDKRDPSFPDVPILRELGCDDIDTVAYVLLGPKGIPEGIVEKLNKTFKKVSEDPKFKDLLQKFTALYEYKDGAQVEKDLPAEGERFIRALNILGMTLKKE